MLPAAALAAIADLATQRPRGITVEAYDAAERVALETVPNRVIEAVQLAAFGTIGYPHRIQTTLAAARYVDALWEHWSDAQIAECLGGGVTADELALIERVAAVIADLTEREYGRRVVPRNSLLAALNVVRHIQAMLAPGSTVFEVGPGSGYVGALLLALGYRYTATDASQAFYVWQSALFNEISEKLGGAFVHVPWWDYMREHFIADAGLVTCNHALCEMHPAALARLAELVSLVNVPLLVCGWGSAVVRNPIDARTALLRYGIDVQERGGSKSVLAHRLPAIDERLRAVLGHTDLTTPDQRFMRRVGAECF